MLWTVLLALFSELLASAFCIIPLVLHARGKIDIRTSVDAAMA